MSFLNRSPRVLVFTFGNATSGATLLFNDRVPVGPAFGLAELTLGGVTIDFFADTISFTASGVAPEAVAVQISDVDGSLPTIEDVTLEPGGGLDRVQASRRGGAAGVEEIIFVIAAGPASGETARFFVEFDTGGGAGDDRLEARDGGDDVFGGGGDDTILGGAGNDSLFGGVGADDLRGRAGSDRLEGGTGLDALRGGAGDDALDGGAGRDLLVGGAGADRLVGGGADDTLRGGGGDDALDGGDGDDLVAGGAGDDTLSGDQGDDTLRGGAGADSIFGGRDGDDLLSGGRGDDRLSVFGGTATLLGGAGDDLLELSTSTFAGDAARLTMTGGRGADTFRLGQDATSGLDGGRVRITDFDAAEGDVFDPRGLDPVVQTEGADGGWSFIGNARFSGAGGEIRYLTRRGVMQFDDDADGAADVVIRFARGTRIDADDLLLT